MSSRNSTFVKLKILVAYAVLLVLGGAAAIFILRYVDQNQLDDHLQRQLKDRSVMVNKMLYYLYRTENDGMLLATGQKAGTAKYEEDVRTVYATLDSLKQLASDSVQKARIDSVATLFAVKGLSLKSLVKDADLETYHKEVTSRIESMMPDSNDLKRHIVAETRTTVHRDTVLTKHSTGNFGKRLRNLFRKSRVDSTIVVTESRKTDSVHVSLSDSINVVLGNLRDSVMGVQSEMLGRQQALWNRISADNYQINELIYRIILDYEREESASLLKAIRQREQQRLQAMDVLAAVAICAIVAVLFFVFIIWRDLGRSNRYKRQLEAANEANEALLKSREKLMLAITHDFKAPLSSIIGYTDLLDRITGDKRQKLYVGNIKSSSQLLLGLVNGLLEFYRLDSDKEELKSVAFSPSELFHTIYATFLPIAHGKGIELKQDIAFADNLEIESDPLKLQQVVNNLLSNAIKFTDKGSVTLSAKVEDGVLHFAVADTGRGISPLEQARLFDMFVRLSSAKGVQGFGLGLSIVDRTVRLLGGEIRVESALGQGSCFKVDIPVELVSAGNDTPAEKQSEEEKGHKLGGRVLLVDDDGLQLAFVSELCKNFGVEADSCQYPEYVERMINKGGYSLVITDIQMPGMDGFQVLATVKKSHPDLPVVAVTARDVDEDDYRESGFSGVLTKPFKEGELAAVLSRFLSEDVHGTTEGEANSNDNREARGIDALTVFAGDDKEACREILESFVTQTEQNLQGLAKAVADGDRQTQRALCHKMLPLFTMVGDTELAAQLRRHEGDAAEPVSADDMAFIEKRVSDIIDQAKNALNER